MPTPSAIMAQLDGLVGSGLRAARAPQNVILWKNMVREIMFSYPHRTATDWDIASLVDTIQTDTVLDAGGGMAYAYLVDSIFDVAAEALIVLIADTTGQTLSGVALGDGGAANFGDETEVIFRKLRPAADTDNAVFACGVYPDGIRFATQMEASADGDEGTNPTTNDVRVYVVYRTDITTRP